jgi:hypothetical protein
METNVRAKFDWLVLKPLWVIFIILAIYYFIRGSWFIGILMIIMDFLLGMIAASLHKEKTFHELARGYPSRKEATCGITTEPTKQEYHYISKAFIELMVLFFVASLILTFHHGLRWFYAIGASVMIGWLGPLLYAIPFWLFLLKIGAKQRRRAKE